MTIPDSTMEPMPLTVYICGHCGTTRRTLCASACRLDRESPDTERWDVVDVRA